VPSQQPQGQLQTQHSVVDTNNYDMDNHNIKSKTSYRQEQEEKHINAETLKRNEVIIILHIIIVVVVIIIIIIIPLTQRGCY
jgi:lipopolysaccharide/colanic/teichoic acid biosynthesis glycosyltransferase